MCSRLTLTRPCVPYYFDKPGVRAMFLSSARRALWRKGSSSNFYMHKLQGKNLEATDLEV